MQNDSFNRIEKEDGQYCIIARLHLSFSDYQKIDSLLPFVDKTKQKRVQKFCFQEDAHRTLFADLLIRKIIMAHTGLSNDQIQFTENEWGKPELAGQKNIQFNVAHSGNWIVCAFANKPIGVDIEKIKPRSMDVAKRFFSEEEVNRLLSKPKEEQVPYFYTLWTLKESFIKMTGKGLHHPLRDFTIRIADRNPHLFLNGRIEQSIFLKTFELDPAYKMAICAASPISEHFTRVEEPDIINHFLLGQKHAA